jgi:hypothetical protein
MKKSIIKTILILLSVFFYIIANNFSRQFQFALVVKYILLFAAMIFVAYILIEWFSKIIIKENKRTEPIQKGLKWIKLIAFSLILMLISSFQIDYISQTEVPSIAACKYFDEYNNLIYQSMYYDVCPELNVSTHTSDTLEFSVYESKEVEFYDRFVSESLNYHITINYENKLITSIDSKTSLVRTSDFEGELTYYKIDTHHIIENNYDGSFSRNEKYAYHVIETNDIENTYGGFFDFNSDDYKINEFTTSYNVSEDYYKISCTDSSNNSWCISYSSFTISTEDESTKITQPSLMETVIKENESISYRAPYSDNLYVEYGFIYNEEYDLYVLTYDQPFQAIGDNYITLQEKDDRLFLYEDSALFSWVSSDNTVYEISKESYGTKIIQYEYNEYKPFNKTLDYYKRANNESMYNNEVMSKHISFNYFYLRDDEYRFEELFKLYSPSSMANRNVIFSAPSYLKYYINKD